MIQTLICRLLDAYLIVMFARIILSWFPVEPGSGLASVYGFLYAITEPVLGPIRRVIPPMGMGGMGLDLSPLVVFFGISILRGAIC
ncbi:MAG TPA: YggT family protein [Acidimicrobiales bacterium]|nr:YggT family protein [Acidimicrobiales bacterium]